MRMLGAVDNQLDDATVFARSVREPQRFAAIYDRYFGEVYRYVSGRLGRDVADDLAAETFLIAFRKRDRFDPVRGSVRPWLYGIATTLIGQHRREETRRYRALARSRAASAGLGEPRRPDRRRGDGRAARRSAIRSSRRPQPRRSRCAVARCYQRAEPPGSLARAGYPVRDGGLAVVPGPQETAQGIGRNRPDARSRGGKQWMKCR